MASTAHSPVLPALTLALGLMPGCLRAQPREEAKRAQTAFAQSQPFQARGVTLDRRDVPRYGRLELTVDFTATYDNPFDPEDVAVDATFTAPNGRALTVPGFLYQPFTRRLVNGRERIESAGAPGWKVRFAPDTVGEWRCRVQARNRAEHKVFPEQRFTVRPSANPGFIRRSQRNPGAFAYAGEKPFFAVGLNVCWGGDRGSYDYDEWLPKLGQAGANWIRIWMCSWNCALEWSRDERGDRRIGGYYGVGVYSLDNAWKLDTILDTAERNGITTMLCFGTYGEFNEGGYFNEGQWKGNPYNAANGGPCAKPADFWTNPEARRLYRRRLRYLVARYGYRTSLHSWEFWNEANAPAAWVGEMARYLKGTGEFKANGPADPYNHLVTTTYGNEAVWRLPEIDLTQTHHYGTGDVADHAPVMQNDSRGHLRYGKPHLMAEFGIDYRKPDREYDPQGTAVNFHNGLWASAFTGSAGSGMLWWWDNYVAPLSLYATFMPLRRFAERIPWTQGAWKPLPLEAPRAAGRATPTDLTLPTNSGWGKAADTEFVLTSGGVAEGKTLPQFLYSPGKAELRTTPRFRVRLDRPFRFVLRVNTVSDRAQLRVLLDGKPIQEWNLSAVPPADPNVKPEFESTEFKREYGIYQARFNRDYGFEVPAGSHTLTLENAAGDWVSLESLTLTGYRDGRTLDLHLYGLTNGKEAILWAHNPQHNWKNVAEKRPVAEIKGAVTPLKGLPAGRYTVEWWDTWRGRILRRDSVTAGANGLPLRFLAFRTDLAARIFPSI